MIKMMLSGGDRVMIERLYPQENDIKTMIMVREIRGKVKLKSEEIEEIELKGKGGMTFWNSEKSKEIEREFEFSDAELMLLKEKVEELDKGKKIDDALLDLCVKVRKGGEETNVKE